MKIPREVISTTLFIVSGIVFAIAGRIDAQGAIDEMKEDMRAQLEDGEDITDVE